jgi:hypothetical protein
MRIKKSTRCGRPRLRSGWSSSDLARDAVRKRALKALAAGPVAIWDGEPKRTLLEHDAVWRESSSREGADHLVPARILTHIERNQSRNMNVMRAETQSLVEEIKQSIGLLRRAL